MSKQIESAEKQLDKCILTPHTGEAKDLIYTLDSLASYRDAISTRAYNFQLTYLRKCEEKKQELAKDEGVQEVIKKKFNKKQKSALHKINKKNYEDEQNLVTIRNLGFSVKSELTHISEQNGSNGSSGNE